MPASVIAAEMKRHNNLYAPTFLALHNLPATAYQPLKNPRATKGGLQQELRSPAGGEVAVEVTWVEAWLERGAEEREREKRKKLEEADAEAARELNYMLHQESGGLLEW